MRDLTELGVSFDEAMALFEETIEDARRQWAARQLKAYPRKQDLELTATALLNDIKSDAVEVNSIVDSRQETIVKTPVGETGVSIPQGDSLCVLTVALGEPAMIADIQEAEFTADHATKRSGLKAWASAPIMIEGVVAGTVCALEGQNPRQWNRGDQVLLEKAAEMISDQVGYWAKTRKHSI